jgi:kynureninase
MLAMEPVLDMIGEVSIEAIRAKSVLLTEFVIEFADAHLAPLGVTLASPSDSSRRGGHVTLNHPRMKQVTAELWKQDVIPDYRDPGGLRIGLSPLTTSFTETINGMSRVASSLTH